MPLTTASSLTEGERVAVSLVGSISTQVLPSLLARAYCWVLTALAHWGVLVGELAATRCGVARLAPMLASTTPNAAQIPTLRGPVVPWGRRLSDAHQRSG